MKNVTKKTKTWISSGVLQKKQTIYIDINRVKFRLILCGIFAHLILTTVSCQEENHTKETPTSVLPSSIQSVVIFGNSIVKHDPSPSIGWYGEWGMAASAQNLDFVHILMDSIHSKNPSVDIRFKTIVSFEQNFDTYDLSTLSEYRNADMIIMNIGENIKPQKAKDDNFTLYFEKLINYLAPTDSTVVIIGESFWPSPVNNMMKEYTTRTQRTFVNKSDLFINDKTNTAQGLFEHEGVANHPSDKGMKNIALRLWNTISKYFPKK